MFINENIIAFTFRFINFISLIGLGFYIFKKQFASSIWNIISKNNSAQQTLYNQQLTLEKKQQELDIILKEELILCDQFKNKINAWNNIIALEALDREKKHNEHTIFLTTKKTQRALQKEQNRVETIIINTVIPELQKSLSNYFDNKHNGEHYLNSIIHFMNERI